MIKFLKGITSAARLMLCLAGATVTLAAAASVPDSLYVQKAEVHVSPYLSIDRDLATAAVSQIGFWDIEDYAGYNRFNMLNGRLTGLTNIQTNGQIGTEESEKYVRGLRSISSSAREALVLVDGYVRKDAQFISPSDIESITVLKDAAATAIYGLRGANGIILINTKHGRVQPMTVTLESGVSFQSHIRKPQYLGAYDYARLYNEAAINDGGVAKYSQEDLDSFAAGDDPYNHPDVNWGEEFLKPYSIDQRYNVSVRGGNERARYFTSIGYETNGGSFNVDKTANTYNTNNNFSRFNFRGNVDVDVTERLSVSLDIAAILSTWNSPGSFSNSDSRVLNNIAQTPPTAHPIFNEDGSIAGNTQYQNNLYALLNKSGYSIYSTRSNYATLKLEHDLDFILKGLSIYGAFSFDGYFEQTVKRNVGFLVYDGNADTPIGTKDPATQNNSNSLDNNYRALDGQAGFNFKRNAGRSNFLAKLFFNWNEESGDGKVMPHEYLGGMGYFHYDYAGKYIFDASAAYQGSEQLGGNGFNFFPSVSAGWVISNEDFLKDSSWLSHLKLRASYGVSGNDTNIAYFQKISFFGTSSSYNYGTSLQTQTGFRESQVATPDIMAERSQKANVGLDTRFFGDRLSLTADVFSEYNDHIIISNNNVPDILGLKGSVKDNLGIVTNAGYEISLGWADQIGDFGYSLYGNWSFARNKVIEKGENDAVYRFNKTTGFPLNSHFGLKSDGLFYDAADVNSHATQSYGAYGPGDIKYVDLSKDGIINDDDRTYLGYGSVPEIVYGFGIALNWKRLDLNIDFQGVDHCQRKISGTVYWEFRPDGKGNVMEHHMTDRWAYDPANGIDTRDTATYPRLSLTGNDGNNRGPDSDFWLRNTSYLRIKDAEIGYTLPQRWTRHIGVDALRLFVTGTNLLTFDKVGIVDPETSMSSFIYPIQRTAALGLNLKF